MQSNMLEQKEERLRFAKAWKFMINMVIKFERRGR